MHLACIAVWHGLLVNTITGMKGYSTHFAVVHASSFANGPTEAATRSGAGASELNAAGIAELSATEAVELLCSRQITASKYASTLLERIAEYQCLNGWAFTDPEKVWWPQCRHLLDCAWISRSSVTIWQSSRDGLCPMTFTYTLNMTECPD